MSNNFKRSQAKRCRFGTSFLSTTQRQRVAVSPVIYHISNYANCRFKTTSVTKQIFFPPTKCFRPTFTLSLPVNSSVGLIFFFSFVGSNVEERDYPLTFTCLSVISSAVTLIRDSAPQSARTESSPSVETTLSRTSENLKQSPKRDYYTDCICLARKPRLKIASFAL